ncbi:hypothetical protein GGU11DRAFT_756121 [Lentinula aff. detonsa]|nr:hypothetical protein GGU11DRAFT_756121 [Lentinula aff. detonsa]
MPRKRTESAILKSERTAEEKAAANAYSRHLADRRYRRKLRYNNPDRAKECMATKRAEMTEEAKQILKDKKKKENAAYYLRSYIAQHGEPAFWARYPHRVIKLRKHLSEGEGGPVF